MNLPNLLTIGRFFLAAGFVLCVSRPGAGWAAAASVIFFLASVSDYYDGYYAKKHGLITDFGKIMDPIADKVLILSAFFIFMQRSYIAEWMFLLIFVREVLITGLRLIAVRKGKILAAEKAGKFKTVAQLLGVALILLFMILDGLDVLPGGRATWGAAIQAFMVVTVGLTVVSGLMYLRNNAKELGLGMFARGGERHA